MGYVEWARGKIKKMDILDVGLLKLGLFTFGIWVAQMWPDVLRIPAEIYLIVFLACWFLLAKRIYFT